MFAIFPAVAQDNTPTPEQVEKVLTAICGDSITSVCLEAFLKEKGEVARAALSRYDLARDILGGDFITPNEVVQARDQSYSDAQLTAFQSTLPSKEILEWLKVNNYMLVPGPSKTLSLLDVRRLNDALFYSKDGKGWYSESGETFSRTDTVSPVWLALRKSPVPDSTSKTWGEQQTLLGNDEYFPNAAEVTWGLTTYKEVRGTYLMDNIWVRTSSALSDDRRVYVGGFSSVGLGVLSWWDGRRSSVLGLSSARKF